MEECINSDQQQNKKYQKQLNRFSLEFIEGDLREFYHLVFEQCSLKLFNMIMLFQIIITITFAVGELTYFEDVAVFFICLISLLLFLILLLTGYKMRHQTPTALRISHVLISMIMYIIAMQISDKNEQEMIRALQSKSTNLDDYDMSYNKQGAFFSMLFSLYQVVGIQIEIKWFFRAFHFLFIILLNWLMLGVDKYAIIYGIMYFIIILILLYQFEVTKKVDSFQMYRVIEDFQSLKTLINDILPMQIFIVQRNPQLLLSNQNQRINQNNLLNAENQTNQNTISHQQQSINALTENRIQKQEQNRKRGNSINERESIFINGISSNIFTANKQNTDNRQGQQETQSQPRKISAQSGVIRNNPSGFSRQKTQNFQGNTLNVVENNLTSESQISPIKKSAQSINLAQANKGFLQKIQLIEIEEARSKANKQSNYQLQTLENEENFYTEYQATNPPLITSKQENVSTPIKRMYSAPHPINPIGQQNQISQNRFYNSNQNSINPLKITFANKLIHKDLQSNTLEDILKELQNIQLPQNPKNNESSISNNNYQSSKTITQSLHDSLLSILYRNLPQFTNQRILHSNTISNPQQTTENIKFPGQQDFSHQHQLAPSNNLSRSIHQNTHQINGSNAATPLNLGEELEIQTKYLTVPNNNNSNFQKSVNAPNKGQPSANNGFQDILQKKLVNLMGNNKQQASVIPGSELDYNNGGNTTSERGGHTTTINIQQNQTSNNNQWNSVLRLENQHGNVYGNDSVNIQNDSAILNYSQFQQLQQQLISQNHNHHQQNKSNQQNLINENLNIYNYVPSCRINKIWEYHNCFLKQNINSNLNNNNNQNHNQPLQNNGLGFENNQQQQQQQIVDEKNYDIKLIECRWDGEESIMVIMNNINERLMRERLLQIEHYKDTMMDTISHNLKTPLNGILAPLESIKLMIEQQNEDQKLNYNNNKILKERDFGTAIEIVKQVSMGINNCQLLLFMINDMIDYSEIIKGEKRFRLDIDYFKISYLTKTLNNLFLDQMTSKKIEFRISQRIDQSEQMLYHDQRRLLQILVNIISNSLKFTLKGRVELIIDNLLEDSSSGAGQQNSFLNGQQYSFFQTKQASPPSSNRNRYPQTNNIESNSLQSKNFDYIQSNNQLIDKIIIPEKKKSNQRERHIRFTIIDTGIGMPQSKLYKLKKMLFKKQQSQISNSSGLGLIMCYSLIKKIGCSHTQLEIQSVENVGSAFSFTVQQFYKSQTHSPLITKAANFQSFSNAQRIQSFGQAFSQTPKPKHLQIFGNFEIKEESVQTKISPLLPQDSKVLTLNIPTFQGLSDEKKNQVLKKLSSSQSVNNINNNVPSLSTFPTKATQNNQNNIPRTINTIGNDEHILDTSTEEREDHCEINIVKVNNQTHPTNFNQRQNNGQESLVQEQKEQSNHPLKEYKTMYSANFNFNFSNNHVNNNNGIQEINKTSPLALGMQPNSSSQFPNSNQENSKHLVSSKQQHQGMQSLNQFSMVSITQNRQDFQYKDNKRNQKDSMYSSITNRHTMIFGKSLKSDAFDHMEEYDDEVIQDSKYNYCDEINSSLQEEQIGDEVQNYQDQYTNNSFKLHRSQDKKGKKQEYLSKNIPEQDIHDILNEQLKPLEKNNECLALEYMLSRTQEESTERKKSKSFVERKAFPTFGEADFNLKRFNSSQKQQSDTLALHPSGNKIIGNKGQSSPLSPDIISSVNSENKEQIFTQKYLFVAPSRNLESNILVSKQGSPDKYLDNKVQFDQTLILQDNQQQNKSSEQELFHSNLYLTQFTTEHSILHTFEMILDHKHILIVDDTIYNIITLKLFLRNVQNLQIEEAYNGRDALEKYQENAINGIFYDYIFMDIEMPIMDGLECIKEIREFEIANNLKKTLIIIVTAYERDQQEVIFAGANALLAKPIQKDKFLQTLRFLLSQSQSS